MMTFKDLKKLVELPSYKEQRVPTVKALEVSGVPVVTEKVLENHGSINVYQNGYVIYRAHKRVTVFSLRDCVHYKYDAAEGAGHHIEEAEFDDYEWHIRLVLEGEDRIFMNYEIQDEWFSDDLKKLDDDKVFAKLQGHWIIEMSEMLATNNAKSIEEIRSFISRQKETYRTPYETQPKDRLRQCVFGGSSNTLDFLPLDRAGNRRFLPVMIYPEKAEVHILEDEAASREYLLQVWAEAMTIYRSGEYSMKFSKEIQKQLVEVQKDFMPEDTEAGQIQGFLEHYTGNVVCSKQLFKEALGHAFEEPKRWQLHNINEIMNTVVTGWKPFSNPRMFAGYGRQRGWEREISGNELPDNEGGFVELSEEEVRQLELPKEWIA
mgnify:FL=1